MHGHVLSIDASNDVSDEPSLAVGGAGHVERHVDAKEKVALLNSIPNGVHLGVWVCVGVCLYACVFVCVCVCVCRFACVLVRVTITHRCHIQQTLKKLTTFDSEPLYTKPNRHRHQVSTRESLTNNSRPPHLPEKGKKE